MLNNLKVSRKILLLLVLPVFAVVGFSGDLLMEKVHIVREETKLAELMHFSVNASSLIHELQKERGASAGFVGSGGQKFRDMLPMQRQATDKKIQALNTYLSSFHAKNFGAEFAEHLNRVLADLNRINSMRRAINSLSIPLKDAVGYYTKINDQFIATISTTLHLIEDPDILRNTSAYVNFLESKERAGIERAVGAGGFHTGFSPAHLKKLDDLITLQNTYVSVFKTYATPSQQQFFNEKMKSPVVAKVNRMRKIALSGQASAPGVVDPSVWFKTITAKIDLLQAVELHLSNNILRMATEKKHHAKQSEYVNIAILIALAIALTATSVMITRNIVGGVGNLTEIMTKLAGGDKTIEIEGANRGDEIGSMAKAVQIFKDNMLENDRMQSEKEAADSDARNRMEKREKITKQFESGVKEILAKVLDAMNIMQESNKSVQTAVDETSAQTTVIASATEEASTSVQTVASATTELTASINEISSNMQKSLEAVDTAMRVVEETDTTMQNMAETSSKIGEVVSMINEIAEQTNLLALNATIEAARAGDAGKGFAVVASEVKSLATQTTGATDEISTQIAGIQNVSGEAVTAMKNIESEMKAVSQMITGITAAVEEQSVTTNEINSASTQASAGTQEVSQKVIQVAERAKETSEASHRMAEAVSNTNTNMSTLQSTIEDFLKGLNAA